ncbi:MAG TPA: nicotinate phosphoribosyltransferase [Pirellulales bacterium]|nr:nicotinate phosphoribosyltransferase [Pirellulales bacterium]
MNGLAGLYQTSLALLTDLYQLTMAYAYWKSGTADHEATFYLHFRTNPFKSGYAVACGLGLAIDFIEQFRFADEDLTYLASLVGADERPLFEPAFLDALRRLRLTCDIDALPEGTPVFAQEPLVRVQGPILQAQLLETPLLNLINFQTLVATKSARICQAARGEPVLEFGARRAQGIDGALAATRAAYVGGCAATSNVLAGRWFGIPVRGTHAHSWVMSFDDELDSFRAYAEAMPNNCVFLVDTYDTLDGVRKAVEVGRWLRSQGHELAGVRLDSGDLAYLSIEARKILDAAGFERTSIVGSSDLDEYLIDSLKEQGAKINVWGVGTRLATAYDQPALGGVYKLSAVRSPGEPWRPCIKLSEHTSKTSTPGRLQVRRFEIGGECAGDLIYDLDLGCPAEAVLVDPLDAHRQKRIPADATHADLLAPIFRQGELVYQRPSLAESRDYAAAQLARFSPSVKRFVNAHEYPVGLEPELYALKNRLIRELRGLKS